MDSHDLIGLTRAERVTLVSVGLVGLMGLIILCWQRQRPPLVVEAAPRVVASQAQAWERQLASARTVDVNTASVAELIRLPQVGPALAQRIVDYREQHGAFASLQELSNVKGIGPKTLEQLEAYVTTEVNE